jgi:MYXO-CTERM domain-containing protein
MCEPSGVKQCVAKPMTCQTAADCPAGWSCDQDVIATEPACMGADCGALPAPMPAQASCRPPYYGAQSGHDLEVPGNPTTTTGSGTGTTGMGGGTGSSLGTAGKASAPEANATDDGQAHESAACSLGHAPASRGAFALLAMAAALLGLKRRRN